MGLVYRNVNMVIDVSFGEILICCILKGFRSLFDFMILELMIFKCKCGVEFSIVQSKQEAGSLSPMLTYFIQLQ